jgi:glutamate dehydrogenase/leucine dehydrogenase
LQGDHFVNEHTESERIDLPALLLLEVDILVPCARAWTISEENAARVRADMVVPGANIPVTRPAERVLFDMDTLYVPDFVANCGAVLAGSLASRGFRQEDIRSVIGREFALKVAHILEMAQARNTTPSETGREIAWQNFGRASSGLTRSKAGIRGFAEKALREDGGTLIERGASFLHRRGMLPFGYAHRLALAHARKLICAEQLRG